MSRPKNTQLPVIYMYYAAGVTGPAVVYNTYNINVNQISIDPELKGLLWEGRADQLESFKEYLEQSSPAATATPWLNISEVRKLIKPIALLTKNGYVSCTAFLANVDATTVLFGAGHCLRYEDDEHFPSFRQVIRTTQVRTGINLDEYKLNFGDLDGRRTADGITIEQLRKAYETTLVAQCFTSVQMGTFAPDGSFMGWDGLHTEKNPPGINRIINNSEEMEEGDKRDFFYLILHKEKESPTAEEERVQNKIKAFGTLPVGDETYLCPDRNAPVLIIGHPVLEDADKDAPMRFDWGKEEVADNHRGWNVDDARKKERILYDLTTVGGNSGSPVFGRGGKVKGIHVEGGGPGSGTDVNKAQIMGHIISDIKRKVIEYNKASML